MASAPTNTTTETIPGTPTHLDFDAAEKEFKSLAARGAGQPYLMAIKLRNEANTLHLRVYLENPDAKFSWADIKLVPQSVRDLAAKTSANSALKWSRFQSGGVAPNNAVKDALARLDRTGNTKSVIDGLDPAASLALTTYLQRPAFGLFFDPTRNHDAWVEPLPISAKITGDMSVMDALQSRYPVSSQSDVVAETLDISSAEVDVFRKQMEQKDYSVDDARTTVKTRGSAQRVFADAVKKNYGYRCAITGILTRDFLVAAHIVPWSEDQTIRLDPANGICLSLLMDCAFEHGHLIIDDDLTVRVNWTKIGKDAVLKNHLGAYDGNKLRKPTKNEPLPNYLERRRALVASKRG